MTSHDGGDGEKEQIEPFLQAQSRALRAFSEFDSNLEAIRDLAVNARAHTKPLDDGKAYFLRLVRRWNSHDSDEDILAVMTKTAELTNDALKSIQEKIDLGDDFDAGSAMNEALRTSRQKAVEAHCSDPSEQLNFYLEIQRVLDRRSRNTVLHSSLLVSAVGSFEGSNGQHCQGIFLRLSRLVA